MGRHSPQSEPMDSHIQTKFTPGPWRMSDPTEDCGALWAGHQKIADFNFPADDEETRANLRLSAAAPDLFEALKMARECIAYCRRAHKDVQSGEGIPVEFFIDAALRKAGMEG